MVRRPFSSATLAGKPYAIYFGFTGCGDVCPTTLQRLVKLRRAAGGEDREARGQPEAQAEALLKR